MVGSKSIAEYARVSQSFVESWGGQVDPLTISMGRQRAKAPQIQNKANIA